MIGKDKKMQTKQLTDEYNEKEITFEISQIKKKVIKNPVIMCYPYTNMDPLQFEFLLYSIYNTEEKKNELFKGADVSVRPGKKVADKGRDASFVNQKGDFVGCIQCKRYNTVIKEEQFFEEITKTVLYLIKDNYDTKVFKYYLFAAPLGFDSKLDKSLEKIDINEKRDIIIRSAKKNINGCDKECCKEKKGRLKKLNYEEIENVLFETIQNLKIKPIYANDLDDFLNKNPLICKRYFRVESIIDIVSFKQLLDDRLKDFQKNINNSILREEKDALLINKGENLSIIDTNIDVCNSYKEGLNNIGQKLDNISKEARECLYCILSYLGQHKYKTLTFCNIEFLQRMLNYSQPLSLLDELQDKGFITGVSKDENPTEEISIRFEKETFFMLVERFSAEKETLKKIIVDKDFSIFD